MKYIKQFIKITCICMIALLIGSTSIYAEELDISEDTTIESVIDGIVIIDDAAAATIDVKESILNNEEFVFYYDDVSSETEGLIDFIYWILLAILIIGILVYMMGTKWLPYIYLMLMVFIFYLSIMLLVASSYVSTYNISSTGNYQVSFSDNILTVENKISEDEVSIKKYNIENISIIYSDVLTDTFIVDATMVGAVTITLPSIIMP